MTMIILAILGILEIIGGVFAMWYTRRLLASNGITKIQKRIRVVAFVLGFALAIVSFSPGTYIGYRYAAEDGPGTIIGAPFMMGFIDAHGRDYVGPLTLPAALGNALFLFMIPQIAVGGWRRLHSRAVKEEQT